MTQTVLVTGAGGFVGSHIVEMIVDNTDWQIVALDSFRHNGEFEKLLDTGAASSRVTPLIHDLRAPFTPRTIRRLLGIDYVVNVASRCHVGESITEPAEYLSNNFHLTLNVLELLRQLTDVKLIHVSTDEVYGPHDRQSQYEHRPSSPYAASKAIQEDCISAYARTYLIDSTIVTSANMFGERQSELAFIPRVVKSLLSGQVIPIHQHHGIIGRRHYTYVRNVAHAILNHMLVLDEQQGLPSRQVKRLPLSGQVCYDNLSLAEYVAELAGLPLNYRVVEVANERPGYDTRYQQLSSDWRPHVSITDGLKATVNWATEYFKLN